MALWRFQNIALFTTSTGAQSMACGWDGATHLINQLGGLFRNSCL